jgi:hypothetical protein
MSSLDFDWSLGGLPYGAKWRSVRKSFQKYFHYEAVKQFEPLELTAVHSYLQDLLTSPEEFNKHTRQHVSHIGVLPAYDRQTDCIIIQFTGKD